MSHMEAKLAFLEIQGLCLIALASILEKHGGHWSFSLLLGEMLPSCLPLSMNFPGSLFSLS